MDSCFRNFVLLFPIGRQTFVIWLVCCSKDGYDDDIEEETEDGEEACIPKWRTLSLFAAHVLVEYGPTSCGVTHILVAHHCVLHPPHFLKIRELVSCELTEEHLCFVGKKVRCYYSEIPKNRCWPAINTSLRYLLPTDYNYTDTGTRNLD
jgi:hypothetical protein